MMNKQFYNAPVLTQLVFIWWKDRVLFIDDTGGNNTNERNKRYKTYSTASSHDQNRLQTPFTVSIFYSDWKAAVRKGMKRKQ